MGENIMAPYGVGIDKSSGNPVIIKTTKEGAGWRFAVYGQGDFVYEPNVTGFPDEETVIKQARRAGFCLTGMMIELPPALVLEDLIANLGGDDAAMQWAEANQE